MLEEFGALPSPSPLSAPAAPAGEVEPLHESPLKRQRAGAPARAEDGAAEDVKPCATPAQPLQQPTVPVFPGPVLAPSLPAAAAAPPQHTSYMSRDALAKAEEERGELEFRVIANDGDHCHLKWLIALKSIISQQLPKMPREYITRLVLDRRHKSLVIVRKNSQAAIGGVCYRPFYPQRFAEIAFLAITSTEQVRGYGTRLMNHLKEAVKLDNITDFVTYADNYAVGYFQKQGFTKGVTMSKERWYGFIKDYDGGTLMECAIHSDVKYLDIPGMLAAQRQALISHLKTVSVATVAFPSIHLPSAILSPITSLTQVPGVLQSGWTEADVEDFAKSGQDRKHLQRQLSEVLSAIQKHSEAWPFLMPVGKDDANDYYDVITDPTDLSSISATLESGGYLSLEMFRADLSRMFSNCRQYNEPHTPFVACANKLEAFSNSKIRSTFSSRETQ